MDSGRTPFPRLDWLYRKWVPPPSRAMPTTTSMAKQEYESAAVKSETTVKTENGKKGGVGGKKGKEDSKHVKVKIPADVLAQADPILQQALESLMYTNTVCTARLSGPQSLEEAAQNFAGMYIPQLFPSCIGSSKTPKSAWTLFGQGYVRYAGGDTREDAQMMSYVLALKLFLSTGKALRVYNFSVQNNVSAGKLPYELNPDRLHELDPLKYQYHPSTFPGVYFKYDVPGEDESKPRKVLCTVQAFTSGKLNFVGAPSASTSIAVMRELEPNVLRQCRVYTHDWSEMGIDIDKLLFRDSDAKTRHHLVVSVKLEQRESKDKSQKSQAARRRRKAELTINKERRKELDRRIRQTTGKKSVDSETALALVPTHDAATADDDDDDHEPAAKRRRLMTQNSHEQLLKDYRLVVQTIETLEDEASKDNGDDKKLLCYTVASRTKMFKIEVTFGGMVMVLNASNPEEDEEAQNAMRWVIAGAGGAASLPRVKSPVSGGGASSSSDMDSGEDD